MPKKQQTKTSKVPSGNRRVKQSQYKSFKLSKRIKHDRLQLPLARTLLRRSIAHVYMHRKLYVGISLVYGVLTLVLVRGFGISSSLPETKELLQSLFKGTTGQLATGATLYGTLLGSNAAPSEAASAYQAMLVVVTSLALIWALRQTHAGETVRVKEAFYRGLYPLVQFIGVLFMIGVQLLPLFLANLLYSVVISGGVAVTAAEKVVWIIFFGLLALLSLYMVTSSVFALYIVTLPDMAPFKALRSARQLVRHRRWLVMRKILFLPLALVLIGAVLFMPIVLYLTPIAEWLYFFMSMVGLALIHSYLYALYRELLA